MSQDKLNLFCWSDAPTAPTGYGHVALEVYRRLQETGKYNLRILGGNYNDRQLNPHGFDIVPAWCGQDDPYGYAKIGQEIQEWKPDVIFLFQDLPVINRVVEAVKRAAPWTPIVAYFPIDVDPLPYEWLQYVRDFDAIATYTEFAKGVLNRSGILDVQIEVLGHSVDPQVFHPLPNSERNQWRSKKLRWSRGTFGVISVNRYSPRKNIFSTLLAFNFFQSGYRVCPGCGCFSHFQSNYCILNGCPEFPQATETFSGTPEAKLYLHMNTEEKSMGGGLSNSLNRMIRMAGPWQYGGSICLSGDDVYRSTSRYEDLNEVYNAGDVLMSTTFGEGWGLTLTEALAAGTRVVAPRNTAIAEATNEAAELVKGTGFVNFPNELGIRHPLVSVEAMTLALRKEYALWEENGGQKVQSDVQKILQLPTWDAIAGGFDGIFKNCAGSGPRPPKVKTAAAQVNRIYITWLSAGPSAVLQLTPALRALKGVFGEVVVDVSPPMRPLLERDFKVADGEPEPESVVLDVDTDSPWLRHLENTKGRPTQSMMESLATYFKAPTLPYRPVYTPDAQIFKTVRERRRKRLDDLGGSRLCVGVGLDARMENLWPNMGEFLRMLAGRDDVLPVAIASKKVEGIPEGCLDLTRWAGNFDHALSSLVACDILVSPDSYLIDGAAALGIPILAVMGPVGARERLKHYDARAVLENYPCQPCWRSAATGCPHNARGREQISLCLEQMSPETVMEALEEML